jgi:exodeoxyribonuclease-3
VSKLLAWNIRHGGGSRRMPEIVLRLLEHAADVVILTEFRRTTGGQIAGVLADHGWEHQVSTEPPAGRNGVLVASRTPLAPGGQLGASAVCTTLCTRDALREKLAEVELPVLGLTLAAVHIPCDGRGSGREAAFRAVLSAARRRRDRPYLIMGDLNAGRHHLDEQGATFTCTRCLGELASMGYRDAWRDGNGGEREYSWYSHGGSGFRIDHAIASAPLAERVRACWYSHAERESGLSDHSALLLSVD